MNFRVLIALLALVATSGCASMSVEDCKEADWGSVGFKDGELGRTAANVERHQKACAESGNIPNVKTYEAGRIQGLVLYCTLINGLVRGKEGSAYRGVCDGEVQKEFLRGFRLGQDFHDVDRRYKKTVQQMDTIYRQLQSSNITQAQYNELSNRYQRLDQDLTKIKRENERLVIREKALFSQGGSIKVGR